MILIALSYATLLIITLFFLFKKKLYFTLNFIILSSIPSLALLVNIDSEFINYEMYYIFSTFILISLIIISLLLPNLSYSRNIIGCSSSSKSLRYLAIVLIGLFIFAGLKAFKGNDSYMALHRGEVYYSTWLYILHKLSYLFVVYHLFFRRLRTHDLIYALVIIASPSLFLFILGFRSPLLINTVFIFTLLIHINLRFFLWKKFPYRKVLILLILFLLLFVLVSVKRHDEAFSSNLLHIFVMQSLDLRLVKSLSMNPLL